MTYLSEVLADSPLVLLKLDEASGTDAIDYGSRGVNGTYSGPTLNQAGYGTEIAATVLFDGTNDAVSIPDAADLDIGGDLTLEALVFITSTSGNKMLWTKATSGIGEFQWYFANGTSRFYFVDTAGQAGSLSATDLALNTWHHVAVRRSGRVITHFLNGATNGGLTLLAGTPAATTNPLYFGRRGDGQWFNGRAAMAAVYNTALSDARIAAHAAAFDASRPSPYTRLTAIPVEAVLEPNPVSRVTQGAVEAVLQPNPSVRITHLPIEALVMVKGDARLTQAGIEVVYDVVPVVATGPRLRVIVAG